MPFVIEANFPLVFGETHCAVRGCTWFSTLMPINQIVANLCPGMVVVWVKGRHQSNIFQRIKKQQPVSAPSVFRYDLWGPRPPDNVPTLIVNQDYGDYLIIQEDLWGRKIIHQFMLRCLPQECLWRNTSRSTSFSRRLVLRLGSLAAQQDPCVYLDSFPGLKRSHH